MIADQGGVMQMIRGVLGVGLVAGLFAIHSVHAQNQGAGAGGTAVPPSPSAATLAKPVPRLVKFGGRLKDQTGQAKSGVASVTFAIYAQQEDGAPLWTETQDVTFEEGGRYTVLLGANSSEGMPAELFGGGQASGGNAG